MKDTNVPNIERAIKKVWTPVKRRVSPIHTVAPILEPGNWKDFDPFLLMMEDQFGQGAFDVHPHRGIETVTFVIEGTIHHYDSKTGNAGALHAGDVQWMTAGRGVVHNETPPEGEQVHVLQLWVNLPRKHKMTEPRYQDLRAEKMPVRREEGAYIRVFSGSSGNVHAPTLNYVPVTFVEIVMEEGASIVQDLPPTYNGFIYVLEGSGIFGANKREAHKGQAMQLEIPIWDNKDESNKTNEESHELSETQKTDESNAAYDSSRKAKDSDTSGTNLGGIRITANEKLRAILFAGEPLHEPIVAHGPFVMNTEEEIWQAYEDYRNGTFLK